MKTSVVSRRPETGEPHWRAVFDCAGVGISLTDSSGRFVASNPRYREMLGYTADELRKLTLLDLTHEDDRPESDELGAQIIRGAGTGITVDKRFLRKDGRVIWVRLTASSIPDSDGAPSMLIAVVEDITERKRVEDALRLSEAFLADAQRISRTGSWVLNPFTGSLFWSREVYHILGFDPEGPSTYRVIMDRVHPDNAERVDAEIRRAIWERRDCEGEHRLVRPDGSIIHIHYIGHPVLGPGGEVVKYIGTIADITARKRAEEELNASLTLSRALAARLLRAQDEERRRIARQLHETTAQELAALKMNLAALDRHGSVAGEQDRALLKESSELAAQAMEDIRVLSYLLHPPLLDEAGLDSALRWYVDGFGHRSGIEVRLDVPSEFGRLPQDIETTLFRSVQESLINIHRHAKSAIAEIRLRRERERVVLEVQDWGRGMPREPGARAEGVGIAGMRERFQQLGGRLEIRSGAGGTTVHAVLPLPPEAS